MLAPEIASGRSIPKALDVNVNRRRLRVVEACFAEKAGLSEINTPSVWKNV
jgi:hypothetical protein